MTPEEANEATQRINKLYREANYHSASDKELEQGIEDLSRLEASSFYQTWYPIAREKLHQEILRRKQKQAIQQDATHHGQIMGELGQLKTEVGRLARARCVDKWMLVGGWIAAIAGVAAVLLELFRGH